MEIYKNNIRCGLKSSLLVLNPVQEQKEIPKKTIERIIAKSTVKMKTKKIEGKSTTPFLLHEIAKETRNKSLMTNISLALNNVLIGAKIAKTTRAPSDAVEGGDSGTTETSKRTKDGPLLLSNLKRLSWARIRFGQQRHEIL